MLRVGLAPFDQCRIGFGDDILVLDDHRRGLDPQQLRRALRMVAGRGDHMLGGDVEPVIGCHKVAALFDHPGAGHDPLRPGPAIAVDLHLAFKGAAKLPGPLGHGLRHVGRVDVAVLRMIERTDQVFGADQRPAVLDVLGREKLVVNIGSFGHRRIKHVFVHALLMLRHPQVAHDIEAGVQAGFRLQPLVEIDRVFVDMGGRIAHVEQRQEPRRVPGRACGQFVPLDQHRVPARLGEMIGDPGADSAAPDNQSFDVGFHCGSPPTGFGSYVPKHAGDGQGEPTFMRGKRHAAT